MVVVVVVTGADREPGVDEVLLCERAERHLHLPQKAVGHDSAFLVEEDVNHLRGKREGGGGGREGEN